MNWKCGQDRRTIEDVDGWENEMEEESCMLVLDFVNLDVIECCGRSEDATGCVWNMCDGRRSTAKMVGYVQDHETHGM